MLKEANLIYEDKEVLIKVVIGVVPAFIMTCFKFAKKLSESMNSLVGVEGGREKKSLEKLVVDDYG